MELISLIARMEAIFSHFTGSRLPSTLWRGMRRTSDLAKSTNGWSRCGQIWSSSSRSLPTTSSVSPPRGLRLPTNHAFSSSWTTTRTSGASATALPSSLAKPPLSTSCVWTAFWTALLAKSSNEKIA